MTPRRPSAQDLALLALAALFASTATANCGSSQSSASTGTGAGAATASSAQTAEASTSTGAGGSSSSGGGGGQGGGVVGDPQGVQAGKALDFLASIGVCVHMTQGIDDPTETAKALSFAGFRNIRDDGSAGTVPHWLDVFKASGARVDVLPLGDIAGTIDMAKQLRAGGALLAIEGPNEPNNFPVTYEGNKSDYNGSFTPVAHFQRDLYAAVKAEPALAGVPVFHSSEAGGSEPDNVGLQFLTIPPGAGTSMPDGTVYADYANTHNYVCGHQSKLVDNVAWNASDPTLNDDWDGPYVEYGHTWHGGFDGYSNPDLIKLPRVTTETGWVTTGQGAITEEQQGRLFLNLYLAAWKRGYSYTFVYMLHDDPGQGYWGFFDPTWQPKKSATYLAALTTLLKDAGPLQSATGKLDYSIANQPATVHDLLLQKSDGTFELVVWNERPMGGSDDVTVDLGKSRPSVKVYDPTTGSMPTQTLAGVSQVMATVSDHPVVLEL